jgi:hypothetical protein
LKPFEHFKAIATGRGVQLQASSSHPDDAAPRPRLLYTAKAKIVEIGGLERQLQAACLPHTMPLCSVNCDSSMTDREAANVQAEQVLTFSERGDTQSPTPALIFEEPMIEHGGLSDLLPTNGQQPAEVSIKAVLTSEVGSNPSHIASTDMSALLLLHLTRSLSLRSRMTRLSRSIARSYRQILLPTLHGFYAGKTMLHTSHGSGKGSEPVPGINSRGAGVRHTQLMQFSSAFLLLWISCNTPGFPPGQKYGTALQPCRWLDLERLETYTKLRISEISFSRCCIISLL